jgi:hypothetical protein
VGILNPLDLHGLEGAASHDLVDSVHHCDGCSVLKLLHNGPCLGQQAKQVQIIGFFHAKTIGLFVLFTLSEIHNSGPYCGKLRLLSASARALGPILSWERGWESIWHSIHGRKVSIGAVYWLLTPTRLP